MLLWQLQLSQDGDAAEREEWLRERAEEGDEVAINILAKKPDLSEDHDLRRLLRNFGLLSQTRQQGFSGLGNLQLGDIAILYDMEAWHEAGMTLQEFTDTMLYLDGVMRDFYEERKPTGK